MVLTPEKEDKPVVFPVEKKVNEYPQKEIQKVKNEVSGIVPGKDVSLKPSLENHESPAQRDIENREKIKNKGKKNDNQKTEKPKLVYYTGKELLRNKIVRNHKEELITTIRGNAKVQQGKMIMRSHEIKVFGENSDYAVSDFPVRLDDLKSQTVITAGYGKFDKKENMAYFTKKPKVEHRDPKTGQVTVIIGDEIFHYFGNGITIVYGHVVIENPQGKIYSQKAVYDKSSDTVELTGAPQIFEKRNIYKADKIILYRSEKKVFLNGHAQVIAVEEKKEDNGNNDQGTVKTTILSDNAEYYYDKSPKITNFLTERENSFVYIMREDSDIFCKKAVARGNSPDELDFIGSVYILDKKNRTRLFGEYVEYRKSTEQVRAHSRKDQKGQIVRPVAYFYNQNDIPTGRLEGDIFERNLAEKISYARGNVNFKLFEKSTMKDEDPVVKSEIIGQWAEIQDEKHEVDIYGNPYIKQETRDIHAGKIVIFPDENRLDLQNSLEGNL